jgi:hypothetical protein
MMGKRSEFELKPRDKYYTIDPNSVKDMGKFWDNKTYYEPCAGDGDLVKLLNVHTKAGFVGASDIETDRYPNIAAEELTATNVEAADMFITNPPFTRQVLLPIIDHLTSLKSTWLLLPADTMHNIYFSPYMNKCSKVVSIGRMYWEPNKVRGKDNYCWYFFPKDGWDSGCTFVPRVTDKV